MPHDETRDARGKRAGRKRFDPTVRNDLLERVAAGQTIEQACAHLGFASSTARRYGQDHPKFREALDVALDAGSWLRDTTSVFTAEVRDQFLDLIRAGHKPRPAARQLGVDPGNAMRYVNSTPAFRAQVTAAMSESLDRVEHALFADAIGSGSLGQRAREFILKNKRPKSYKDQRLIGLGGIGEGGEPEGAVPLEVDDKADTRAKLARALADPRFVALAHAVHAERDDEGSG